MSSGVDLASRSVFRINALLLSHVTFALAGPPANLH